MKRDSLLVALIVLCAATFVGCSNNSDSNMNGGSNANMGTTSRGVPTSTAAATPTPKYTEEQARQEREKAKTNKETVGQSLDDAWIHAKLVTKLIGDTQTPERKINVDVVNGAVTLRGTVDTAEAKAEAERVAKDTDGVTKVTNDLKVVPAKAANTNKSTNSNKPARSKTP